MSTEPTPSNPEPATVWSSARFAMGTAASAWLLYLAAALVRCIVYGFAHPYWLMGRHTITAIAAVAMTALLYAILRRQEADDIRHRLGFALAAALPPAAILSVFNYNAMFVFAPQSYLEQFKPDRQIGLFGEVLHSATENYFVFAAWAALYIAVSHAVRTQDVLRRAAASEAAARSAELRALRFQLDPHFLFNALNTVSGLVLEGRAAEADRTIEALCAFLRTTFAIDASEDVTLAEEMRLQRLYLEIEQIRFGDRLAVSMHASGETEAVRVPALILQPVVENSVRHGVARTANTVSIAVDARRDGDDLLVRVEDDGPGGDGAGGHGVGLANVAARLALRYGNAAKVEHRRLPQGRSRTELRLPFPVAGQIGLAS